MPHCLVRNKVFDQLHTCHLAPNTIVFGSVWKVSQLPHPVANSNAFGSVKLFTSSIRSQIIPIDVSSWEVRTHPCDAPFPDRCLFDTYRVESLMMQRAWPDSQFARDSLSCNLSGISGKDRCPNTVESLGNLGGVSLRVSPAKIGTQTLLRALES